MAVKVVVSKYGFNKPILMPEKEFISYKQIFQVEPTYNLAPKSGFWDEFTHIKYFIIAFFVGIVLAMIWDALAFIPAISFFILIMAMISGTGQSMANYSKMSSQRQKYYDQLRELIKSTSSYEEFSRRFRML